VARYRGDYVTWRALAGECLAIQREFGEKLGISFSLMWLGIAALAQDDLGQAARLFDESRDLHRGMEPLDGEGDAGLRDLLAEVARRRADYGPAEELLAQSLALHQAINNREGTANALDGLGRTAGSQGELAAARSLQMEALAIRREGRIPISLAQSLHALAILAAAQQHPERAARLFGAVEAFHRVLYSCGLPIWRAEHERGVDAVRVQLGDALFEAASAEGRAMTLEQAVALALSDSTE
jgi:tetratricopeptide (TPR) repeat protein